MATFKICVFKHQIRQDDKYPVSIRVCWKRKYGYIGTEYYVSEKQISNKKYLDKKGEEKESFELKDAFIIRELNKRIGMYEELKSKKLGFKIHMYNAQELANYFKKETTPGSDNSIDFISFSRKHIQTLIAQKRKSTAKTLERSINALIDFCNGREKIIITELNSKFLTQFEIFLRGERTLNRKNQFGKIVTTKKKGLSDVSVKDYLTDIRTLFNAACEEYNDEEKDEIKIAHYPFKKYKIVKAPESDKRNISAIQLQCIRNASEDELKLKRTIFARDVFILSFFLVGMNFADMYDIDKYENGRLSYERRKTKNRRQDRAFISIKVEPEAAEILEKYRDKTGQRVFDFYNRYSDSHTFSSNVNKGLKKVAEACNIDEPLSTYYARHTWATMARNKCGVSKDDVDLALNHVDQGVKMADIYIEKDWSLIDRANRAVIDHLNIEPLPSNNQSEEMPKSAAK